MSSKGASSGNNDSVNGYESDLASRIVTVLLIQRSKVKGDSRVSLMHQTPK